MGTSLLIIEISNTNVFQSPYCFSVLGDVDEAEIEPLSSFGLKRGGRETKTPIKYQDMEWKTRERKAWPSWSWL